MKVFLSLFFLMVLITTSFLLPPGLEAQEMKRVIVIFEGEIDPGLADKYGGEFIRESKRLNAGIFLLPELTIEDIKNEPGVKDAGLDVEVKALPTNREPVIPNWIRRCLMRKLRRKYIRGLIKKYRNREIDRTSLIQGIRSWREAVDEKIRALESNGEFGLDERYLRRMLRRQYIRDLIRKYRRDEINRADFIQGLRAWREAVEEQIYALQGGGGVSPRWNIKEAGINAENVWNTYSIEGDGAIIAFLDSGVDYMIPDLDNGYLGGYDFINSDNDPMDDHSHGTEVASLALAEGEVLLVGIAPQAKYYAFKVVDAGLTGGVSDIIDAIDWVVDHNSIPTNDHIDIISISLGTYGGGVFWPQLREALINACNDAYNAGIILVAGSGNDGYTYSTYPATLDTVISVGGHAEDQTLLWITDNGKTNGGVDVVAPGERAVALSMRESGYPSGRLYYTWGTSYATPHISGLLALELQHMRQSNIELNNGYLWELVRHSAAPLTGTGEPGEPMGDPTYEGKGKANALEAVNLNQLNWPMTYTFEYPGSFIYNDHPAFYIGTTMHQDTTLTNVTDTFGNTIEDIENLVITTTQKYQTTGEQLPGDSQEDFGTTITPLTLDAGINVILQDDYDIPWVTIPGLYDTVLDLEFNFVGSTRNIKITDNISTTWCPPGPPPE